MRNESVTSPPTLGAGRRYSYRYPITGTMVNLNDPTGIVVQPRPTGLNASSFWGVFTTGAPPAGHGALIYNGRPCWALTSNTVPSGVQLSPSFSGTNRPLCMPFQETRPSGTGPASFQGLDDAWCWSVSVTLAFDAIPGAITGDVGLAVGVGTRCVIRGASSQFAGIEFGPTGAGTLGVFGRQLDTGAVTLNQNVAGVADMTLFHKYEIRLLGPTAAGEASVKFLIDDQVQLQLPYGAGTVLPSQKVAATNQMGFTPGLINLAATAAGTVRMYIVPETLLVCCAPTEDALA